MFPDLRNNLKSNGSSLYKCSISYSTLKRSFAPRIWTTTSGAQHIIHNTFNSSSWVVLSIFGGLFAGVGGLEVNNRGFGCEMRCLALFQSNFEIWKWNQFLWSHCLGNWRAGLSHIGANILGWSMQPLMCSVWNLCDPRANFEVFTLPSRTSIHPSTGARSKKSIRGQRWCDAIVVWVSKLRIPIHHRELPWK